MKEERLFNPRQLTSARLARGFTIKDLSEKAEVSRQAISSYESGKASPKLETALKIANVLDFPVNFLYDKSMILPESTTYFRKRSAATNVASKMQEERLVYSVKVYEQLTKYVNIPEVNLPELVNIDLSEITDDLIAEKAQELRKLWGVDNESPIENVIALAEVNGVVVVESNMANDNLDAVSRWYKTRPFIMLTDNRESSVRRRFNVAHELGHIILHNAVENDEYDNKIIKKMENQAHLFASNFLMPNEAFMKSLLSTSPENYVNLKNYWKVSIQAMIFKTAYLELINEDRKLYLNKQISFKKWRKKEPLDDILLVEKPTLNKKIFKMITENKVKEEQNLISEFNLPLDELSKIIGIDFQNEKKRSKKIEPVLRLI
ncbi:helix-turn-helix domain-containing protein [Lactococcus garvieae]|uniref:helix-turn-helix domain-containing protein n=1 Tax=Lactococcus garvieae TaxID=1363 RepID=UPI0002E09483|nr:XRE family transcriptional regulator [Lactococcus garvieae]